MTALQQNLSVNNSVAKLGDIEIQAVNDVSGVVLSAASEPSLNSLGGVAAHEVAITPSLLHFGKNTIDVVKDVKLQEIIDFLLSDEIYALTPLENKYNTISLAFPKIETKQSKTFTEKIKSEYENITNVSQERPELISVVDFLPLFDNEKYQQRSTSDTDITLFMTPAGKFVNTQMQVRNLLYDNIVSIVQSLKEINASLSSTCNKTSTDFYDQLLVLRNLLQFLFMLITNANDTKRHFNLHHDSYILNAAGIIDTFVENYANDKTSSEQLKLLNTNYGFRTKNIVDVFVKLGYVEESVKKKFSSTKLWLQLLAEYKSMLVYHSLDLLELAHTIQKLDVSATVINTHANSTYFYVVNNNIATSLVFLVGSNDSPSRKTVSHIMSTYDKLYSTSFKSNDIKISALLYFLSKEYRYSIGIAENADLLSNTYNFTAKKYDFSSPLPENIKLFDVIFGTQQNITELSNNESSLSSLSQFVDGINKILTFESEPTNIGTNSYLSSVDYCFNSADISDVTKLSQLSLKIDEHIQTFCKTASVLDIMYSNYTNASDYSQALNNPTNLFVCFFTKFNKLAIANDVLCPVFALANRNLELKSALFLYAMSTVEITSTIKNKLATGELFDNITSIIQKNMANISRALKTEPSNDMLLTNEKIESTLFDDSNNVISFLRELFSGIMTQYNGAMIDLHTCYSGLSNLTLYMTMFDVFVTLCDTLCINKLIGYTFVGSSSQQSALAYVLSPTNVLSSQDFFTSIVQRLDNEIASTQIMFYAVYTILTNLQSSIKNYINSVKNDSSINAINEISSIIGTNQKYLMSTQQIYLLHNTLLDVFDAYSNVSKIKSVREKDMRSLDNFVVSQMLRDLVFSAFSDPSMTSKKGINKKLLTVGIPLGLSDSLKRQANVENLTRYDDKQIDLVNVCVYKIDIVNDDIIYKPQKFMFDLSRFTSKNDSTYLQNLNKTLLDVVQSIPTRDVSSTNDPWFKNNIQYYLPSNTSLTAAFDSTYDFLSTEQKYQIAKNHVLSFIFELYIKFLTGVSVSEDNFTMGNITKLMNTDLLKQMIDTYVLLVSTSVSGEHVESKKGGLIISNTFQNEPPIVGTSRSSTPIVSQRAIVNANANLSKVSQNVFDSTLHGIRTISGLSYALTPLSDKQKFTKKLLTPKMFDRIFNVIVDPDDFEIDVEQTNKSSTGTQTLLQLISTGDVIATVPNSASKVTTTLAKSMIKSVAAGTATNKYSFISKDKTVGDSTFEKYFVTIEKSVTS